MLVTSRSFEEYVAMFALTDGELTGRLLDCSAGAADFAAAAVARGATAVAVDPAYALSKPELATRAQSDHARGSSIAAEHPDRFTWSWYGSPQRREELRSRALGRFVQDFVLHPQHYVAGQLPRLPFVDRAFDLAVCSHLLFTWGDQLGLDWHLAAVRELVRVATQVRIFPTVLQGRGEPVPFLPELLSTLSAEGMLLEQRRVDYQFQVGADRMLVVSRPSS